jgi:glyoxylase-like metal-dependent hydrolase (beta-lactamase superfamily II)
MKKILKWLAIVLFILLGLGVSLYMIYLRPFIEKMKVVNSTAYDEKLTLITGGGGNSGILVSDSLVVVIDTKMDDAAQNLYEQVKKIAGTKPILVINTHIHPDHTGGNKFYKGQTILAGGNYKKEVWIKEDGEASLPNQWLVGRRDIPMDDDTLTILNLEQNAHTNSDVIVYLQRRKLLFAGDLILNKQNPIIMDAGTANGYLWAFERLKKEFDIQHIVPGHGELGGPSLMKDFETYFNDMKLAANESSNQAAVEEKYKDWNAIPFFMSPSATIKNFKKEMK